MRYANRDPYWLTARYPGQCAGKDCHATIRRGDRVFYYPVGRHLLCARCGETAAADFLAAVADEAMYTGGY